MTTARVSLLRLTEILSEAQSGEQVKRVLNPHLRMSRALCSIVTHSHTHTQSVLIMLCVCAAYGGSLIEHCLMAVGLPGLCKVDSQSEVTQGKNPLHSCEPVAGTAVCSDGLL